jgi:hypothetical protein
MNNKLLLLLFVLTAFQTNSYSQKIKIRIDLGNSINFSSYNRKLFMDYYQGPISTSEYTYKKMARCSLLNIPTNLGISLEFDYKERNHFTLGYMNGEIISIKDRVIYNYESDSKDSMGYRTVTPWSNSSDDEIPLSKVSFAYSRDFGKGWLRFSPFLGISYAWIGGNPTPLDTVGYSYIGLGEDSMFPSSKFYIETFDTFSAHTSTMMGSIGINFRMHSKKRELFALKLYYEQGFRTMTQKQTIVYRNSNKFIYNLMYSYGSAFYIKLSIPIPIYDFNKHRK